MPELKTVLSNADPALARKSEGYVDPTELLRDEDLSVIEFSFLSDLGFRTADFRQNARAREKSRPCSRFGFFLPRKRQPRFTSR